MKNKYGYQLKRVCATCPSNIVDTNKCGYCIRCLYIRRRHEKPKYHALHVWMLRNYPKTGSCAFCHLEKRTAWALQKGCKYERDIKNFIELCYSCHTSYDWTDERSKLMSKIQKGRKRKPQSEEHKRKIRESKIAKGFIKGNN
jgi:hypothetical protein